MFGKKKKKEAPVEESTKADSQRKLDRGEVDRAKTKTKEIREKKSKSEAEGSAWAAVWLMGFILLFGFCFYLVGLGEGNMLTGLFKWVEEWFLKG